MQDRLQIDHRDSPNVQVERSLLRDNMNLTSNSYINPDIRSPVILKRGSSLFPPRLRAELSFRMTKVIAA